MHALQDLGEAMVRLTPARLAALALPERLADAIAEARRDHPLGGSPSSDAIHRPADARRRSLPIQAMLEQWEGGPNAEKARLTHVERWRTRLLSEGDALDRLCAEHTARGSTTSGVAGDARSR